MRTVSFSVEHSALTSVPVYEGHRRGKNWLAIVVPDPTAPGGLGRTFCTQARGDYYYLVSGIESGQVLEFGADYLKASGRREPKRWYGLVVGLTDSELVLRPLSSAKEGFSLQQTAKAKVPV